jgi:RNA polymerase sigma-70 factor (ECF subfamily)
MAMGEMALSSADALTTAAVADDTLLARCRQGDATAFTRLVALHERMVFSLAARLLGDTEEARDISQDVFMQVYRTLPRFEGRSSLKTWIYRIVVNQCQNRRRWWRRRRRALSCPLEDLTPSDEAGIVRDRPETDGPHERIERRELVRRMQSALLRVSFEHRAVLLLREVEGLGCDEIASAIGVAPGTVKSRLSRAREALRRSLEAEK